MSTPIRQFVKSALSPNFIKSPQILPKKSPITQKSNTLRSGKLLKTLQFTNNNNFDDLGISILNSSENINKINIKVTNETNILENKNEVYTKRKIIPLINTPDRSKFLRNGLESNLNWNILGKGTFGTVIQAIYKGEKVAMKVINNKKSTIIRESNAIKLRHPNIIQVLQVTNDKNYHHGMVVMRDCQTIDLQRLLDNNETDFSIRVIAKWCLDICLALKYCHENGVLHLDVKPKNVLVKNDVCLLCDFGNSLDVNDEEQKIVYVQQLQDNLCGGGTVAYTAPELFCCNNSNNYEIPTFYADVYSFGITMWQLETRKIPYQHLDNVHSIIYAVVKHKIRPTVVKSQKLNKYQMLYISCWDENPLKRNNLQNIKSTLENILSLNF